MLTPDVLRLDCEAACRKLETAIRGQVLGELRRRGVVLGLSGGIDSSVVAALAVRALGPENVLGLFMPERDCSDDALRLGRLVAQHVGIRTELEDIGPALEGAGCYRRQLQAIRTALPSFEADWKFKLTVPPLGEQLNVTRLVAQDPAGVQHVTRLGAEAYLQLVAATNFKQRLRKTVEYYHADRLRYAVAGTPNKLEYELGFFVKQGDGAADLKPIAHLYKTQVYALADYLGVPAEIRSRPPTTDTFSLPQTQEEFYFALPRNRMDLCLWAHEHGVGAAEVAPAVDLNPEQVERVFRDIAAKKRQAAYLRAAPLLVADKDA